MRPTTKQKNRLPEDVRYLFNEGVELYQLIQNYELGVIGEDEFIKRIRDIKKSYSEK